MHPTEPSTPTDPQAQIDRLQAEIDRLRVQLAESHRLSMLGIAAGMIAHEINNILTPVLGYARAALAKPENADLCRKALERSASAADRAGRIAESVLTLARGGGAGPDECEIAPCVSGALDAIGTDLGEEGIRVCVDAPVGSRAAISPVALEQVLLNLFLNARQAMNPGGGQLTIRVGECSTWNTRTTIEISDTGKGIPLVLRDRIFEPFVSSGGTGLGLAVCRALVEAAGGTIRARPREGGGTTVVVELLAAGGPEGHAATLAHKRKTAA